MTGLGLQVIWSDKTSSWVRKPDILSEGLLAITRIIQNIIPNSSRSVEFPMTLLTVTWMQLLNVALRHSKPVLVSTMCWEAVQSSLLFISLDSLHSRLRHSENNITAPLHQAPPSPRPGAGRSWRLGTGEPSLLTDSLAHSHHLLSKLNQSQPSSNVRFRSLSGGSPWPGPGLPLAVLVSGVT